MCVCVCEEMILVILMFGGLTKGPLELSANKTLQLRSSGELDTPSLPTFGGGVITGIIVPIMIPATIYNQDPF